MAMRSRSEEWEPNWSEEVLTRGATSQEILDEWRPECWFREDQQERARSPAHTLFHPHPSPLAPTLHSRSDPAAPHRRPPSRRRRRTTRSTRRLASRHASTAPAPLSLAASMCTACPLHAHCTLTARSLHAHTAYTLRANRAHCPPARPPARPQTHCKPTVHAHCTHLARTGTAHTTSPTRRGDPPRLGSARGDGAGDTDQEEGWTARATSLLKVAPEQRAPHSSAAHSGSPASASDGPASSLAALRIQKARPSHPDLPTTRVRASTVSACPSLRFVLPALSPRWTSWVTPS